MIEGADPGDEDDGAVVRSVLKQIEEVLREHPNVEDSPHRNRRFYWRSGKVQVLRVWPDRSGDLPTIWCVAEQREPSFLLHDPAMDRPPRHHRFRVRRYLYALDFIGPWRDADYHEED